MRYGLLTLFLSLSLPLAVSAQEGKSTLSKSLSTQHSVENERPYRAMWSMQLGGQFIRDSLANQKTQSNMGLNLGLEYDFTEIFSLSVSPRITFRNGHVQSATSTNGRESNMELVRAAAMLSDRNYYAASLGVVDMTSVHSSLLVAASFPAAKIQVSTGEREALAVSAIAMAAVPSSATLTSNSQDYDKTPSFGSAALRIHYGSPTVDAMAQISQFQYRDIPLNVSTDSVLLGNTSLESANSPQTAFRYQFQGQEVRSSVAFGMTRSLKFKAHAALVRNSEAPSGYNQAYVLGSELAYILNDTWRFMPSFTYFQSQPDATIANYNDPMISTNRVGYASGMTVQYKKLFRIGALGGDREVVFERSSQARERFLTLALETLDAPF